MKIDCSRQVWTKHTNISISWAPIRAKNTLTRADRQTVILELLSETKNITRKFLKTKHLSNNAMMRVLPRAEKLEFVRRSVHWIQGQDIMDTCFILNYGYEASLPWPQVQIYIGLIWEFHNFHPKVSMRLENGHLDNGLNLVPETYGMAVPSSCTIVIIAGKWSINHFRTGAQ